MAKKTNYEIVVVQRDEIQRTPNVVKRATPPPYDPASDGPAFDRAWEQVARLKQDGKLAAIPPRKAEAQRDATSRETVTSRDVAIP